MAKRTDLDSFSVNSDSFRIEGNSSLRLTGSIFNKVDSCRLYADSFKNHFEIF